MTEGTEGGDMLPKVPDGGQFELWWPGEGSLTMTGVLELDDENETSLRTQNPQTLVLATFDREEFRAELERRLADDPDADYMIIWGGGFDVYQITREQV